MLAQLTGSWDLVLDIAKPSTNRLTMAAVMHNGLFHSIHSIHNVEQIASNCAGIQIQHKLCL